MEGGLGETSDAVDVVDATEEGEDGIVTIEGVAMESKACGMIPIVEDVDEIGILRTAGTRRREEAFLFDLTAII